MGSVTSIQDVAALDVAPAPRPAYRADIQGLRAIAIGLVVAFHAGGILPGGFIGVDVFFVISGYVITAMLERELSSTGSIRLRRFYARRFKRLTPALALMVVVTLLASALLLSPLGPQQAAAKTGLGAILLSANFVIEGTTGGYFDAGAAVNPLLNTWSLSVEEQFYLVFPAVLLLGWAVGRRRRMAWTLGWPIVAILICSLTLAMFGLLTNAGLSAPWLFGFYSPFARAWEFAAGALVAIALTGNSRASRILKARADSVLLGVIGLALMIVSVRIIGPGDSFPSAWTGLPVLATAVLLAAGAGSNNPVSWMLSVKPLTFIGDRSYSIYLWHWPFIVFASLLFVGSQEALWLAAALSLIPALLSFALLEEPLRRLRNPRPRTFATIVVFTTVPAVACALFVLIGANNGYWNPKAQAFTTTAMQGEPSDAFWQACMTFTSDGTEPLPKNPRDCSWRSGSPQAPVYLIGDSTAVQYTAGLDIATGTSNNPLTVMTAAMCPALNVYRRQFDIRAETDAACRQWYIETMNYLKGQRPGIVFVSQSMIYWRNGAYGFGTNPDNVVNEPVARSASLMSGLSSTIETLKSAGHKVVVVLPLVQLADTEALRSDPQLCSVLSIIRNGCSERVSTSMLKDQLDVRDTMAAVAADAGATAMSILDFQCPDDECGLFGNGVPLYRDYSHLSTAASRVLAPRFADVIASLR